MKTQFGKQQLITLASVKRNVLGVVAAEGYRVVASADHRSASERLAPDCRASGATLRPDMPQGRLPSPIGSWRGVSQTVPTAVVPGVATVTAVSVVDSRLPAPAWAAFVLNHALCG